MTETAKKLNALMDAFRAQLPVEVGGLRFTIQDCEHSDEFDFYGVRLIVVGKFPFKDVLGD